MAQAGLSAGIAVEPPAGRHHQRAPGTADALALLTAEQAAADLGAWRALAAASAEPNVFFHPGLLLPAIDHLDRDVAVGLIHGRDGRPIGLAPLASTRLGRIAPALSVWVHDYGPLGTPLFDAGAIDEAATALIAHMPSASLILPYLATEGPTAAALLRAADRAGRPVAVFDAHARAVLDRPDGPGVRAMLPTRRRKEYARQMRRLADLGELTVETAVEPDHVRARLEEFLTLEAAGWKGHKGTALGCNAATAGLARDIVFNRSERGTVRVMSLRLGDHPIAIIICFIAGTSAYTWKIAYDETHARFSPGAQLMLETADALFADPAIMRIDSCAAANHPMVDHLWPGRMQLATLVIGPAGGGIVYRAGLAAFKAELEARAAAKTIKMQLKRRLRNKEAGP